MLQPSDAKIKAEVENATYGKFALEPLPAGFGHTLGTSLRRMLLSSIPGAAITTIKFAGVTHQFTNIPGVKEDVIDILLNLKSIHFNYEGTDPVVVTLDAKGLTTVTAADLDLPEGLEVINKDQIIATLGSKSAHLEAELVIEKGIGYATAEDHESNKIGVIAVDSLFSPVVLVTYKIEPARIGQKSDFDRLILEITTNGAISPRAALMSASNTLQVFFERLASGKDSMVEEVANVASEAAPKKARGRTVSAADVLLDELNLPTRTINALKRADLKTLADLGALPDEKILKIKNLGEKSVQEITDVLKSEGLR
ncbi:MAG: DNA-directed RNA polymerase subunit alpha [candidate division WWE3 bacterium]|nr:DNA-directed RNA polymerase subunit alpha [candidate division WWE3 bacterium]